MATKLIKLALLIQVLTSSIIYSAGSDLDQTTVTAHSSSTMELEGDLTLETDSFADEKVERELRGRNRRRRRRRRRRKRSRCETEAPTQRPTSPPTMSPTQSPVEEDTMSPTDSPTEGPTVSPTDSPTSSPTKGPTMSPTSSPLKKRTMAPTDSPTMSPTKDPSVSSTSSPTSASTVSPTKETTVGPTKAPTDGPTMAPTAGPTMSPTEKQTLPTLSPTLPMTSCPSSGEGVGTPCGYPSDGRIDMCCLERGTTDSYICGTCRSCNGGSPETNQLLDGTNINGATCCDEIRNTQKYALGKDGKPVALGVSCAYNPATSTRNHNHCCKRSNRLFGPFACFDGDSIGDKSPEQFCAEL